MLSCQNWPVGICTWSLGNDITVLEQAMIASGMTHLHLSLDPVLSGDNRDYLNSIEKKSMATDRLNDRFFARRLFNT